jgi:hypothetical protein
MSKESKDPFEVTDGYVEAVGVAMEHRSVDNETIKNVLLANERVRRDIINDRDFERWRHVYPFHIPEEILFDWLREIAWAESYANYGYDVPLVTFHPTPPDTEDSYFQVLDNDTDLKDSLAEAVKKAYFRLKDDQKEERRQQFLKLKEEFEPDAAS